MSERIVLAGHAYRPSKGVNFRAVVPGCECGETLLHWAVDRATAVNIHREHKKRALKVSKAVNQ